jgi:hypothetical protein
MPSTEKGVVGPTAGEERVLDPGEPEVTRGSREHAGGARSTCCGGTHDSCWHCNQCTTKRTSSQCERQFTALSEREGCC